MLKIQSGNDGMRRVAPVTAMQIMEVIIILVRDDGAKDSLEGQDDSRMDTKVTVKVMTIMLMTMAITELMDMG